MQILFSPQQNDNEVLAYSFSSEVITVNYEKFEMVNGVKNTLESIEDTFDFTGTPDGIADEITSMLPVNPIISAKRESGVLSLELLNFIRNDATEAERFPEWQVI